MTASATDSVMTVVRVHTDGGSHIEPPLQQDWDDLTKLRWQAAVVTADCGLAVTVEPGNLRTRIGDGPWRQVCGVYDVYCDGCSSGARLFDDTMAYLRGMQFGAERMASRYEPGPDAARWSPDTEENP